jgi:uncharacterized membrane protein
VAVRGEARHWRSGARLAAALLAGVGVTVGMLAAGATWGVAANGGWVALALVFLCWVWLEIGRKDSAETEAHATAEDVSRGTADLLLVGACVASIVAVGYTLVAAGNTSSTHKALLIMLAVGGIALAWATVHTVYTLRYAGVYYGGTPGGIEFSGPGKPDYLDIAYVGFTIGMTFQVSDTNLTVKTIRRMALRHAILSYVFGSLVVAVTINVVASLLNG